MTEESSKQSAANLTDLFLDEAGLEGGLDIPPEPASEREAEEAEDRAIETERADECEEDVETPSGPSRIIALTGACGGAGTTSIALQMAYELSQSSQKKGFRNQAQARPKVCLLDLDFESGGLANAVDVPTHLEARDLMQSASKIDDVFVTAVTRVHHSGFCVIASDGEFGGNGQVNPNAVLTLLDIVAGQYETVILDLPTYKTDWTVPALMGADHRAIVTPLSVAGLRRTVSKLSSLDDLLGPDAKTDVILNKAERRALRASLNESDARKALGRDALGSVCVDHDLTNNAINCGEPCGVIRREARFVKDVRDVLSQWETQAETVSDDPVSEASAAA